MVNLRVGRWPMGMEGQGGRSLTLGERGGELLRIVLYWGSKEVYVIQNLCFSVAVHEAETHFRDHCWPNDRTAVTELIGQGRTTMVYHSDSEARTGRKALFKNRRFRPGPIQCNGVICPITRCSISPPPHRRLALYCRIFPHPLQNQKGIKIEDPDQPTLSRSNMCMRYMKLPIHACYRSTRISSLDPS